MLTRALTQPLTGPLVRGVGEGGSSSWLLRGEDGALPTFDYDFVNRRYYRQGAYRTEASEFTVVSGAPVYGPNGLFFAAGDKMTGPAPSFVNKSGGTFLVEMRKEAAAAETTAFSLSFGTTGRLEVSRAASTNVQKLTAIEGGAVYASNTYGDANLTTYEEREIFVLTPGSKPLVYADGATNNAPGTAFAAFTTAFTTMGIGYRARFSDLSFEGYVKRVTYWPSSYSAPWVLAQGLRTTKTNIHVLGDSFVTSAYVSTLRDQYLAAPYRVFSMDGVGGSSITAQADRFDLTPDKYDRTLVIMDGGLDTDAAATIAAIDRMVAHLSHNRWVYVMPSPQAQVAGSPARITFDGIVAAVRAHVGESRFIDTLTPALANGDGSTQDNADIANQIWPTSLRNPGDTIHPTTAGWGICIAAPLAAKLNANGWA